MARRRARVTEITYYDRTERLIAVGNDLRRVMQDVVDDIADAARPNAPRSTGAGHAKGQHAAELIKGEVFEAPEGWEGRVGWTRPAYYLYMHEKGWVHKSARPFLRPAVQRRRDV